MNSRRILAVVTSAILGALAWAGAARAQGAGGAVPVSDVWPREFKLSNAALLVYQPQINSWEGNLIDFRAAVSVTPTGSNQQTFDVIWGREGDVLDYVDQIL